MKKFAVIGNPVMHSLSPMIHQEFARQFSLRLRYTKIQVDKAQFNKTVDQFRADNGSGLNVTVPFKMQAFEYANRLSPIAKTAKAVNTLAFKGDDVIGDNTDAIGLLNDLRGHIGFEIKAKRLLIIGAGGAVRGVLSTLLEQSPSYLVIANRTVQKAEDLAYDFESVGKIKACGLEDLKNINFDLVINATAASLSNKLPDVSPTVVAKAAIAYDMMYSAAPTVFMQWARLNGAAASYDGLGMLVEQAAASFKLWHGVQPNTGLVLKKLRNHLSNN